MTKQMYLAISRHDNQGSTTMNNGRVYHDTRYFNTYDAARVYAQLHGHPTGRIIPYSRGWAIQLYESGPYVN